MTSPLPQLGSTPSFVDALALYNSGDVKTAKLLLDALLEKEPLNVEILVTLGMCQWQLNDFKTAEETFEMALAIAPNHDVAMRGLGMVCLGTHRLKDAYEVLKKCVTVAAKSPQAWLTLGLAEQRMDRLDDAEKSLRHALSLKPNYPEALNNLGTVLTAKRNYRDAIEVLFKAIAEKPEHPDPYRSLAKTLRELGSDREALMVLKRAVRIDPKCTHAWNEIGGIYRDWSDTPKAIEAYRKAFEVEPANYDAKANLSCILSNDGACDEARELCSELLEKDEAQMGVRFRRAIIIPAIMESMEQIEERRAMLHRELDDLANHKGIVDDPIGQIGATNFYLAYHGCNDRELQVKTATILKRIAPSLNYVAPHIGRKRKEGRIRLGIYSRHLGKHTIGILWSHLFARLDKEKFEVFLYHNLPVHSGIPEALINRVDKQTRVSTSLDECRRTIARDELDILYYPDLGMEPLSFFQAFARLAAVQAVTWGHPLTTGIPTIDYFVSATQLEIASAQDHYSEKLVRLPTLNTFYLRPEAGPDLTRERLGVRSDATMYICPQTLFKFHPDIDAIFKGILDQDPNGQLLLLDGTCARHTALIKERFYRTMPDVMDRVIFTPRFTHDEFLSLLKMADVMLDPTNFGGGSTTIQALSFGTPVVTLPSQFLRARISYAAYRTMGVSDLIAKDADDYCRIAIELGRSKGYRDGMREVLYDKSSVLFSNPVVVTEFETFLEQCMNGNVIDHPVQDDEAKT